MFSFLDLNLVWFILLGVLLIGYAILDGFDLGVGVLHLFTKGDTERRISLNSIGPVWDGNEVWLVTAGGALFAAFPHAYATAFSAFYIPFMILLCMLIFRAVALEFRSKEPMPWWRATWDVAFSVSSIVASVLFGVAVGNLVVGIPLGEDMEFQGTFFQLLNPYSLLVGVFNLTIFAMHGAIYLYLKTEGDLQQKVKGWVVHTTALFVVFYIMTTIATLVTVPSMIANFQKFPVVWLLVPINVLAIANIPRSLYFNQPGIAFLSSCVSIATLILLFGAGVFPNMIISSLGEATNLTIYSAASSQKTLGIMLIIAILGMPCVIAYTSVIYWVFRGKVQLDKFSY
ncbi:MAG: cytochrome d ubiquinol oxidase subunit II [Candidatus Sumerlaeia bacterium]|nr:cytochrome d ubiquinol oxidase subunit II [Candidatus Sumerlaeia bacterium]